MIAQHKKFFPLRSFEKFQAEIKEIKRSSISKKNVLTSKKKAYKFFFSQKIRAKVSWTQIPEPSLLGQTVHWISAQFFVSMSLNSRDKSLEMFQSFSGFRVQIPVT